MWGAEICIVVNFCKEKENVLSSMLQHGEAAITACNRTKDVRLGSDKWETGWCYAKNHSESKNKTLHLNQTESDEKYRKE